MRKGLLTLIAAVAIVGGPGLVPTQAMTVGTAAAIEVALAQTDALQEVVYVCRHRSYTSRRVCWWRPSFRGWRWHWRWRRWR